LTSMDDRIRSLAGDLFITSGGAGTVIRASLPLDPRRAPLPSRQGGDVLAGIEQVLAETAGAGVFVGREREIETLRNLFEEAAAGRGRMVLLSGEAGIGKTRTANELATYASSRGAEVLVGRCYEGEGAPAYWPWIQVLRAYVRGRDPAELPLEKTLAVLRGEAATSITLAGLGEDEVARFMEVVTGARPPEPVLSAVYRQTEGNPLFVREVVRLLAAEGHLEGEDQAAA